MIRRWATSRSTRVAASVAAVATAMVALGLVVAVDGELLADGLRSGVGDGPGLVAIAAALFCALSLRAYAWRRVLPELGFGHSLAAIHLALGANHVLPFRLGEAARVVSVVRRTRVGVARATSSTVMLRSADFVALAVLGVVAAPGLITDQLGLGGLALLALVAALGVAGGHFLSAKSGHDRSRRLVVPGPATVGLVFAAWLAEAVVVWRVAQWFDISLGAREAIAVLAAAVVVQVVAVTPGGVGTYEAAGTAALVAMGVEPSTAITAMVVLHAVKTAYSLAAGAIAVFVPNPTLFGRVRMERCEVHRPGMAVDVGSGPVVLFLPAFNEAERVGAVVARAPSVIDGHRVEVVVVDDASHDDTAKVAADSGATVVSHPHNMGLGAAVRTGFRHATARGAVAAAFCDADGEYDPADVADLVRPILAGRAHYVVGSRFRGDIRRMLPHRRLGNLALTRCVRFMTRVDVSDGQSGYRAVSAAALAELEIAHDYNYAQVLTIDLVGKGFGYHEVPIGYEFRRSGRSFVRLGRYLRQVVPTVWRQLNSPASASAMPSPQHNNPMEIPA
ncbi:MAG: lysylphosphatidylglycerol synthase domain-containing protein [Acidimicrobiales bacterium]